MLEPIDDVRALLARVRRERVPLLLFFSTPGCPYCIEVRRNYLAPRARDARAGVLIREVDIVSQRSFIDADGKPITEARFAARFGARVVPVVLLVDANLTPLGDPLIGLDGAGFYEAYLANAIEAVVAVDPPRAIEVRALRSGDGHVRIEVEDSGPGVPLEVRDRLF
ncbi:MAG: hypothetical protein N3D71_14645, partial [Burkholderiaceae bacterium]|nr:hypothetical protein [Burkholderiaceae bacterium]